MYTSSVIVYLSEGKSAVPLFQQYERVRDGQLRW